MKRITRLTGKYAPDRPWNGMIFRAASYSFPSIARAYPHLRTEIGVLIDILQKPCLHGLPSQSLTRLCGRGPDVHRSKVCKPAEMRRSILRRPGLDRDPEALPDKGRDLTERHALFRNAMVARSRSRGRFDSQPEEPGRVETVHCGPVIQTVPGIDGNAFFPRDTDEHRHEAVIPGAVNGRRQPQDRNPDAPGGKGVSSLLGCNAGNLRLRSIRFGGQPARCPEQPYAGGHDERLVCARQGRPHGFDSAPVDLAACSEARKIMHEAGMDNGVGCSGSYCKTFKVFEISPMGSCPGFEKCLCGSFGTCKPEHLMPRGKEFLNNSGADEAGGPGNKNAHCGRN